MITSLEKNFGGSRIQRKREILFRHIILSKEEIRSVSLFFEYCSERLDNKTPTDFFYDSLSPSDRNGAFYHRKADKQRLIDYIQQHKDNSHLNYKSRDIFTEYDQSYFYLNLYKALVACDHIRSMVNPSSDVLIDIGSGAGTFSLAAALSIPRAFKEFHLLDHAQFQLSVSQLLLNFFGISKFSLHLGMPEDIYRLRGIRVASYWLCSNHYVYSYNPYELASFLFRDGMILVDYQHRLVEFASFIGDYLDYIEVYTIECKLPEIHASILKKDCLRVHMLLGHIGRKVRS